VLSTEAASYLATRGYNEFLFAEDQVDQIRTDDETFNQTRVRAAARYLAWPLHSAARTPIGVLLRKLDGKEYRLALREGNDHIPTLLASKKDWDQAWRSQFAILVEGAFDRVALKRAFPEHAVFARLSRGIQNKAAIILRRYTTRMWIVMDNDEAGQRGAEEAQKKLEGINTTSLGLKGSKDPGDFLHKYGSKALREHLLREAEALEL
jgi:DNA primase